MKGQAGQQVCHRALCRNVTQQAVHEAMLRNKYYAKQQDACRAAS